MPAPNAQSVWPEERQPGHRLALPEERQPGHQLALPGRWPEPRPLATPAADSPRPLCAKHRYEDVVGNEMVPI